MAWTDAARLKAAAARRLKSTNGFTFSKTMGGGINVGYKSRAGKSMVMAERFPSTKSAKAFVRQTQVKRTGSKNVYKQIVPKGMIATKTGRLRRAPARGRRAEAGRRNR